MFSIRKYNDTSHLANLAIAKVNSAEKATL